MEPEPPVDVWGDDNQPRARKVTLDIAKAFIDSYGVDGRTSLYIQDRNDNEWELLSTGKWNRI